MDAKRSRKKSGEINAEHKRFLVFIGEKRPELEIMKTLNLSKAQLKDHTLRALQKGEVSAKDLAPYYQVVFARSLPEVIRERMSLASDEDAEVLVKIEGRELGVLLTVLHAAPQLLEAESVMQDTDEEESE